MSILPWDDWIYHTKGLAEDVKQLHDQAVTLQGHVKDQVEEYNGLLDKAKILVSGNAALLIIKTAVTAKDELLKDFEAKLQAVPEPVEGCVPAKFGSFLAELVAGGQLLKAAASFTNVLKGSYGELGESIGEAAGEGIAEAGVEVGVEVGAEIGAEVAVDAALSETGVGIVIALAIDAIFGAINGAKEKQELDDKIDSLNKTVEGLEKGNFDISGKLFKLKTLVFQQSAKFAFLANTLNAMVRAPSYKAPNLSNIDSVIEQQAYILTFHSTFVFLRNAYQAAVDRDASITKSELISAALILSKRDVTKPILERMLTVLAQHSEGFKQLKP